MKHTEFKMIRKRLGKTQSQMGTALGVSERTVQRYEKGFPIPCPVVILVRKLTDDK